MEPSQTLSLTAAEFKRNWLWFRSTQNSVMYENQEWVDYLCDRIPLKRPGKPADLDGAVVFLASDASEYMTAQTLLIDGGISGGATRALSGKK